MEKQFSRSLKGIILLLFITAVVLSVNLLSNYSFPSSQISPVPRTKGSISPLPTIFVSSPAPSSILGATSKETALVSRIIDGDTIELEDGRKLRYIGIDTPETVKPNAPTECFGKEASAKNKELVLHKEIEMEKDISNVDRYGRLLRFVYVDSIFVNDLLVREGYAYASTYPPDVRFSEQFRNAQKEAEKQNKGLWGANCPAHKSDFN